MVADFGVDVDKLGVVDAGVLKLKAFADNVRVDVGHKVFGHHRSGDAAEQVAAVFGGVADDAVHLVQALAVD